MLDLVAGTTACVRSRPSPFKVAHVYPKCDDDDDHTKSQMTMIKWWQWLDYCTHWALIISNTLSEMSSLSFAVEERGDNLHWHSDGIRILPRIPYFAYFKTLCLVIDWPTDSQGWSVELLVWLKLWGLLLSWSWWWLWEERWSWWWWRGDDEDGGEPQQTSCCSTNKPCEGPQSTVLGLIIVLVMIIMIMIIIMIWWKQAMWRTAKHRFRFDHRFGDDHHDNDHHYDLMKTSHVKDRKAPF